MSAIKEQIQRRPAIIKLLKPGQGNDARLSLRLVTLLELISVTCSVLLTVWAIVPLFPQDRFVMAFPALISLALIIYSQHQRHETLREIGLSSAYFWKALRLLILPVSFCGILMILIGYLSRSLHRSTHFEINLLIVPFWGVAQQYVLQGFIYRRFRTLLVNEVSYKHTFDRQIKQAIFWTAAVFALVHLPNLTLSLLTFAAALLWSWVYERAPNLWALGFSHGLLSLIVMHSLPTWLLHSMSVGYKHFLYQKFVVD
ncbi:MAG: CPBP family intramembrane metalloprotease [Acidobacteria bacterium]|nr:CPBP family intramembrane metalloprotease [Acidobacteriota bacterium]